MIVFFLMYLKHLHGKFALHPFCNRKLPIVCDDMVDPEFGSGTYSHEPKNQQHFNFVLSNTTVYDVGSYHRG